MFPVICAINGIVCMLASIGNQLSDNDQSEAPLWMIAGILWIILSYVYVGYTDWKEGQR